jgi:tRNA threonylcarbamoyl adenosine modification protein (Sua5/YciO/YrdC/YwlC family)
VQFFEIHPTHPQQRLIQKSVDIIKDGGVIAYPTDSAYALGCHIGDKQALERIRDIRQVDKNHNFTLVVQDLSEISTYAKVDNPTYRILKACTPGAYTFILKGTRDVPKRLLHPKRKTIGLRVPNNVIVHNLLTVLAEPLMSSTLILPEQSMPLTDAVDISDALSNKVDLVIDGGHCGIDPTTVVDFTQEYPEIVREGKGDLACFK